MFRKTLLAATACALTCGVAYAGSVTTLKSQAPQGAELTFQLTDGRVLAQSDNNNTWYTLTPDNKGSYVNGTWKQVASLPSNYSPYAESSAVLADGRLLIIGGEYNFNNFELTNLGAIYDPQKDTWTNLKPPPGKHWKYIGDSPNTVLPDGRFLIGDKLYKDVAAYDPKTGKWTIMAYTGKSDFNAEEGWTLLPNGTILTYDVLNHPNSEIYDPSKQTWTSAGSTVVNLASPPCCSCVTYGPKQKCYHPPGEVGPGMLLPDGSVFATGSIPQGDQTSHTAIYKNGTWTTGPDFPNGEDAGDAFSALLPSGNVLQEVQGGNLYEYDGKSLTKQTPNAGNNSLMVLPTGEILIGGSEVYTGTGKPKAAWAPTISNFPASVTRGSTYPISGTQFNGLSQANSFGDEETTYTNYPLVRITNKGTGHVFYARTHDHSTMGVATGKATVSTNFDVSSTTETGASTLVVVANGIPSKPVAITVN